MSEFVSISTPAFTEQRILLEFLRRAYVLAPTLEQRAAALDVVVVDDHSQDGTPLAVERALADYPDLKYVRLSRNCGPHAAISAGWVSAGTGFAELMTVLLVGQGSILLMLRILGEYLWRTFDEARGRPRSIIEENRTSSSQRTIPQLKENP